MCDLCQDDAWHDGEARLGRKKLWTIDRQLHCSIVGTCLTLGELRRIGAKLRLQIPSDAESYDIHNYFVSAAGEPGPVSKALHKTLDRKFSGAIRRFDRVKTDQDLEALWKACLEDGDVPGPYWALMSHRHLSEGLAWRVFAEVHMLSHLVGASNRADVRRLRALEVERDDLAEAVAKAKRRQAENDRELQQLVSHHAAEIQALNSRLLAAETASQRLDKADARIRELENGDSHRTLQTRLKALDGRAAEETARADALSARLERQAQDFGDLRKTNHVLEEALCKLTQECEALEAAMQSDLTDSNAPTRFEFDLRGQRIAYVGGRASLIPHLRTLVERANGSFAHHDGGIEENNGRLIEVLANSDVILCPVDCVSHGACRKAKRLCKQRAKAFVPLRSSGLSSFVNGLKEVATGPDPAGHAPGP